MGEMIERAARAICVARGKNPEDPRWVRYPGPTYEGKAWHEHEDDARAVIEAIRNPTDAMLTEGGAVWITDPETTSRNLWHTMIDAALK